MQFPIPEKITVNDKYEGEILPGKYVLNLKLTTEAGAGIYENAVTFNIISSPLTLTYKPASVRVEKIKHMCPELQFSKDLQKD